MKHSVTKFKSPEVALKELEPFIKNGTHLESGKRFTQFGDMLSREMLVNWLISATLNFEYKTTQYSFTSDPDGSDGAIVDLETNQAWITEHVMVPQPQNEVEENKDIHSRILHAIDLKRNKGGEAYASNKLLIVFLNSGQGLWIPNQVASQLPSPLYFEDVWVVGLEGVADYKYSYRVVQLLLDSGNAPIWSIDISEDFGSWSVNRVQ
jgi:hypothetical protein